MLTLGIVLLVIGIVLVLAPLPLNNVDTVGWLLALVGVVLVLVALLAGVNLEGADAAVP